MIFSRFFKILSMNLLYWMVNVWSLLLAQKYNPDDIKKVAILFMPGLGMGDLIMLSPVIQKTKKIFPHSEINLITWVPELVDFKDIKISDCKKFKIRKNDFDLIISPTLTLRHLPFIFLSKYWIGYFAKPKIQSNFKARQYVYDLKNEHYLWRGVRLIKALDLKTGEDMEQDIQNKSIEYPSLKFQKPSYFDEKLKGVDYAVIAPFAQFDERQWPIDRFADVARNLIDKKAVAKVVIVGGQSDREQRFLKIFMEKLKDIPSDFIVDAVGKNNLMETSFIIKNSRLHLGLDTGPAQIAYLVAPRSVVIFITVDSKNRIPFKKDNNLIRCVCTRDEFGPTIDTGLVHPNLKLSRKRSESITSREVIDQIYKLLEV